MSEEQQASNQFGIQRIYVKDASFELPMGPKAFQSEWKPKIKQDLSSTATNLSGDNVEVVLSITITAQLGEEGKEETAFIVEVHQAGIFLLKGMEGEQKQRVVGTLCPSILFPYARETLDSLVIKGSFPPLMLPPINFDAVYQQAMAQKPENVQ